MEKTDPESEGLHPNNTPSQWVTALNGGCGESSVPAHSHSLEERNEGFVCLSAHLRQLHVHMDTLPPASRLRAK